MPETLYRKYRPQNFDEILGQDIVKTTLQNEIINKKIAHAYIFTGSRGLGKTSTARIFAKSINCLKRKDKEYNPCNSCDLCVSINTGQNVDFIEIDAASNRGINEIRQLKDDIGFVPSQGKYRVFVIDEVHMLTTEAFNALLKTLEEPPQHVVFILATTELHKVPDTILSRCQIFNFKKVTEDEVFDKLTQICKSEKVKVDDSVLRQVAKMSGGFLRDAESLLGQVLSTGKSKISLSDINFVIPVSDNSRVYDILYAIYKKDAKKIVTIIEDLDSEGYDLTFFIKNILSFLQDSLINIYKQNESKTDVDLGFLAEGNNILSYIKLFDKILLDIKKTDFPSLYLEASILEFIFSKNGSKVLHTDEEKHSTDVKPDNNPDDSDDVADDLPEEEQKEESIGASDAEKDANKADDKGVDKTENIDIPEDKKDFFNMIKSRWDDVISVGRKFNHSLSLSLKVSFPVSYGDKGDNVLVIGCYYDFHLKKLQKVEIRKKVEEILKAVFNVDMEIMVDKIEYDGKYETSQSIYTDNDKKDKEDGILGDVLDILGGQVVEG